MDGVILCGRTQASVVKLFCDTKIPTVSLGQNVDIPGLIPTVAADDGNGVFEAIKYSVGLGHERVLVCSEGSRGTKERNSIFMQKVSESPLKGKVEIDFFIPPGGEK